MGMSRSLYVLTGISIAMKDFEAKRLDWFDDKYLPYIEGHPGVKLSMLYGEGEYVYIGYVVARHHCDDNYDGEFIALKFEDPYIVRQEIQQVFGNLFDGTEIRNYLATIWR